ncbi:alpha/beta hydrolase [Modestobacter sp. CPCC 205119]|uniref:Alpha/beta hydrolase n=1 Tax=Goekera deserti TaxID=2497753 RepID=A0A7K3WHD6_9ACTN|nr:alpha/beta hydrolase [Goekera deserti]
MPLFLTEPARATADLGLLLAAGPLLRRLPGGDGHPVLVLPGLLADDGSTRLLRTVLGGLGYDVHGWRLGRNVGPTALAVDGMRERLEQLHHRHDRPVTVIGWSLGGIYARDLARRTPHAVRQVITLGSPFRMASVDQTRVHRAFDHYSHLHVERRSLPLEGGPLPVPSTSVYSRYDGIVHWSCCLETPGPRAENIAVQASHLGLGHHPAVVYAVADRLAQAEGAWQPFRAPGVLRPAFPRPDLPASAASAAAA